MRMPGWAVALGCVAPLLGWWAYGLFDLDEGFYAAVVADMLRRGDWVTPTYNGAPWFEKPILAYWLAMPSVLVLGPELGPRLPSVLCTLGLAALLRKWGEEEFGEGAGDWAALAYCGSLLPAGLGRMMMTDSPLALALAGALWCLRRALDGGRWVSTGAGACVGLAVLAKGPVGLVLFLLVWGLWTLHGRSQRPAGRLEWIPWALAFVAVVAAWYVPCYLANGDSFVQKFLVEQNVGRFAGGDKAHAVPWWGHLPYYPLALALGMLPYWPFAAGGLFRTDGGRSRLLAWAGAVAGFFTVSLTKLPHYVLPAAAPLALLVGAGMAGRSQRWGGAAILLLAWNLALGLGATAALRAYWSQGHSEVQAFARRASAAGGGLVVYRIGREGGPGTGTLRLQETSHPSILFYYGRPAVLSDDAGAMASEPLPFSVLTRRGRWDPPLGWKVEKSAGREYDLYRVTGR
jgi:4-amino-4-deoxy-L-arabinose transferase-like glycosyltransferase